MERTDTSDIESSPGASRQPAQLLVQEHGQPMRAILLLAGAPVRIGRAPDLELSIDDPRVSRVHAEVRFDGRSATLQDLDSSNGTWIGEERVQGTMRLASGIRFRVGSTLVTALLPDPVGLSRDSSTLRDDAAGVFAVDPASTALLALARRVAPTDLSVLIQGETGVGKELIARTIHRHSARSGSPISVLNCAALSEPVGEELCGDPTPAFEAAVGGTVLLDEVSELSGPAQARVLRVLQDYAAGEARSSSKDVRVLATSTRDIAREVAAGRVREDLYFRLNGVTLDVPPLRSRPREILPLAQRFLEEGGGGLVFAQGVTAVLTAHRWPGNVRELRNAIESARALAENGVVRVEHLPASVRGEAGAAAAQMPLRDRVDETERKTIVAALESTRWNQSRAARVLGISRRALIYKMERYGLKPLPNSQRHA